MRMAVIDPPYTAPPYTAARRRRPDSGAMLKVSGMKRATPMVAVSPGIAPMMIPMKVPMTTMMMLIGWTRLSMI